MKSLLARIRISVLSLTILILSFFIECTAPIPPPPIPEPGLEPDITSVTEKLKIHFIKMQRSGDAILIDLGDTEILIDGGFPNSGVATYLNDYVDGPLEVMVATHPHPDHIGGLIKVLESFDVHQIWLNGDNLNLSPEMIRLSPSPEIFSKSVKLYQKFMNLVNREGASIHEARRGQTIDIGILSLYVLHPDTLLSYRNSQRISWSIFHTMNNNSIVLRLRYGNIGFLFTGDALKEAEASILKAGLEVRADILKVGHHGAIDSSSGEFLKAVMPKVAVYMAGEKISVRGPKKPHPDTITALKRVGADVYGTGTHGTIVITTDGKTCTVDTERKGVGSLFG